MTLDDIDEAVTLRNHRLKALHLSKAAACGPIEASIWYGGTKFDPFSVISAEIVRAAIVNGCNDFIAGTDARLAELGVAVDAPVTP